jgi:ketosteroid isomerase-like protein
VPIQGAPIRHHASMRHDDLDGTMAAFQECIERRDVEAAAEILDEDYALVLVHPEPATMPRARWLEVLPDYVVDEYQVIDRVIDIDGDCATVLHSADQQATVLGSDRSGRFVITDVWRRRDSRWRLWRRHSTPLAALKMPGA